jgi:hypothetical protein
MAKFYLLNNTKVGSVQLYAGSLIDDAYESASAIRAAGGCLITTANGPVATAAALAQKLRKRGAPPVMLAEVMQSALDFSHERFPKGPNLGDTSPTLQWSDGLRRVLPAATLSANRTITLGVAAGADGRLPTAGVRWEFTRLDAGAFTLAFVNGGPGAGTLRTLPVSAVGSFVAEFDGTNWEMVA